MITPSLLVRAARYALLVEPLSPELALVDPELAERARAVLADARSPARPAPGRQPEPPPRRSPMSATAAPPEPVEPTRRSRGKRTVIVAAIAVAAGLAGAIAIWVRHSDSAPSSGKAQQLTAQAQRGRPPATASSKSGKRTATRSSNQAAAVHRQGNAATRSRRRPGEGSALGSPFRPPLRPPAFHAPSVPKEPLDEITLPARARRLEAWLTSSRTPSTANQRHWLYQHAWIVTGASFGWWHGAQALRILIRFDRRVESRWGIGYRSEEAARRALAEVEARAQ